MKITIADIQKLKNNTKPFSVITAYDYPTALIINETNIPMVLVGDSASMVVYGYENTIPINLKLKALTDSKNSFNDKEKDLFCKIVMGDKSDAKPSVFKKCGIKTASKYYHDRELFNKKLREGDCAAKYELNKTLVDFNRIPEHFVKEFNTGDYTVNYKRV